VPPITRMNHHSVFIAKINRCIESLTEVDSVDRDGIQDCRNRAALAQNYPARPVTMIVPFAAGA